MSHDVIDLLGVQCRLCCGSYNDEVSEESLVDGVLITRRRRPLPSTSILLLLQVKNIQRATEGTFPSIYHALFIIMMVCSQSRLVTDLSLHTRRILWPIQWITYPLPSHYLVLSLQLCHSRGQQRALPQQQTSIRPADTSHDIT